jgi:hypothetical protein
MKEKVLLQGKG